MPRLKLFKEVISRRQDLHPDVVGRLRTIMDRVAMGDIVKLEDEFVVMGDNTINSPNTLEGIEFLLANGLLLLDPDC